MRLFTGLGTATLFAIMSVLAQGQGQPSPQNAVHYFPKTFGCPIAMHARQSASGRLSEAGVGRPSPAFAAHLQLDLNDGHVKSAPQMLKAKVIVHGWNGKERILPAMEVADDSADIGRTFTVTLAPNEEAGMVGELKLPGFTAARIIELESVTYTDGSTWKFAGQSACQAVPDMLMPVESR